MPVDQFPIGGLEMPSRTTWYILTPTFAVSGLLLVLGLSGAWYVHRANREVSSLLDENLAAAQSAERLVLTIRDLRVKLDRLFDTGDAPALELVESSLSAIEQELGRSRNRETGNRQFENSHYGNLQEGINRFRKRFQELGAGQASERVRGGDRELTGLLNEEMIVPAEELLKERQRIMTRTSRQNLVVARRIGLGLLLLGVCGAVAGLLVGFGVARNVHRSLVEISVPVRDIAGRLNEFVGPIRVASNTNFSELDNSLRMLAEKTGDVVQRLHESQQQSLRREQLAAVGQLAAGLAHELRNPLMSVKLIIQTAVERAGQGLNVRDLAVIDEEVTRLDRMLQTFLDFARPPQLKKQPVQVGQLAERTLEVVRPRAAQQDVQLHFSVGDNALWIDADESQMRQVLLNLLLNSLDVLPGGGNIWVKVHSDALRARQRAVDRSSNTAFGAADANCRREGLPQVVVRVADDGPGLSPELGDRAFDPFVSTKDTGIGLGLSICHQIVESHDGRISAGNSPEGGAEVTIYLPQSSYEPAARAAVGAAPTHSPPADDLH